MKNITLVILIILFFTSICYAGRDGHGYRNNHNGGNALLYGIGGYVIGYNHGQYNQRPSYRYQRNIVYVQPRVVYVQPPVYVQPQPVEQTDCQKIITRTTRDGQTIEIIEETCSGRKTEYVY